MTTKAPRPSDAVTGSPLDVALQFDPFLDDFGAPGDRVLRDLILKTRKIAECAHCGACIPIGSLVRSRTDIVDNEMMSWKWCHTCTCLMVRAESKDVSISMPAEDEYASRCKVNVKDEL